MRRIQRFINAISEFLKNLWAVLLVLLLLISIPGCQLSTLNKKKQKTEIWLIDGNQGYLFRMISDSKKQTIKIIGNAKAMDNFMCMDKDEFDYQVEGIIE